MTNTPNKRDGSNSWAILVRRAVPSAECIYGKQATGAFRPRWGVLLLSPSTTTAPNG